MTQTYYFAHEIQPMFILNKLQESRQNQIKYGDDGDQIYCMSKGKLKVSYFFAFTSTPLHKVQNLEWRI